MLKYTPAVFTVKNSYQIMARVTCNSLFRVRVGEQYFYDEQDGTMRSQCDIHRVTLPSALLDAEKKYTICIRKVVDRRHPFAIVEEEVETEFEFKPIPRENIRIYHIADAHNLVEKPCAAAEKFGNIDLLVMNGDIPNNSLEVENFDNIYKIAEKVTHGNIPIIFTRGNHDMRGYFAERLTEYAPNHNGKSYYTVRIGNIWAIILNCGEDKIETHETYSHTNVSDVLRRKQTEFIKDVIKNADTEYAAEGVEHKLIICHVPFTMRFAGAFNIEEELFTEWARILKENVRPELMLCGHKHALIGIYPVGCEMDHRGQPCLLVIGSNMGSDFHMGCGIVLESGKEPQIEFFNSKE